MKAVLWVLRSRNAPFGEALMRYAGVDIPCRSWVYPSIYLSASQSLILTDSYTEKRSSYTETASFAYLLSRFMHLQ
jgi:hypothetical protein